MPLSELRRRRTDGAAVSHRRLESLMPASGTGRRETVRLLRAVGARPSRCHGAAVVDAEGEILKNGRPPLTGHVR